MNVKEFNVVVHYIKRLLLFVMPSTVPRYTNRYVAFMQSVLES